MIGPVWLTDTAVAGTLIWEPIVTSWLGTLWLADVPVSSGSVTWSTRREIPGSLDLLVPRLDRGRDWMPGTDPSHPLHHFGQYLDVSIVVSSPVSHATWTRRLGRFLIESTSPAPGAVRVTARSMMRRVAEARFETPQPTFPGGTFKSEVRRLVPAMLGVRVDSALTDRGISAFTWGESRVDALAEVARAWPARLRESEFGEVWFRPPLPSTPSPVVVLRDGEGGTAVAAPRESSREGVYNRVVVRGTDTDEVGRPTVQEVAEQETGPLRVEGPYGLVNRFYSSPLITSRAQALSAAQTMLEESLLPTVTRPVELAPDPRLELDDAVTLDTADGTDDGYVAGMTIPLTTEGNMRVDVEVRT